MRAAAEAELPPPPAGRVVVASANPGKLREIRAILAGRSVDWSGLDEHPPVSFPDEGAEYEPNALAKARAVAEQLGLWAVADDSGLEVAALGGAPGPLSARYGGPGLDDAGRVARLLEAIAGSAERSARFVCIAAAAAPDGRVWSVRGECAGRILESARGEGGFGYDPVFEPEGHAVSMAELSAVEKNRISHRARAFRALCSRW